MKIRPTGSRCLVRVLSHEFQTPGGIIMPGKAISGDPEGGGSGGGPGGQSTMKVCEILAVGEGKLNTATGQFIGSRFKVGDRCLLRHGISAVVHIDYIPGHNDMAMVQEDTLVAHVEFESGEKVTAQ